MFDQQKYRARIRGFINRIKFRLANWLLTPFNLMIVSATDFRSIQYVQTQFEAYIERSGALPQRLKLRAKLRWYSKALKHAVEHSTALSSDPVVLGEMPLELRALARVLQEALESRQDGTDDDGTRLARTCDCNDNEPPPAGPSELCSIHSDKSAT